MGQLVRGAPGLYLKGLPSEPVLPLSAVTGFVGIASRGPLHTPELVRSWDEFLMVFGDRVDYGVLPHEVFGFFRNGGRRCYVVRVADLTDYSAENAPNSCPRVDLLKAASNRVAIRDAAPAETIRIHAINEGRWGNALQFEIRAGSQRNMALTTLDTAANSGATTLKVAEPFDLADGMAVRLVPPGDPFGGPVVTLSGVTSAADTVTIAPALTTALPKGTTVLGQGFKLVVRLGERTEVFDNLSMSQSNPRYFIAVVNGLDDTLSYVERQALGTSILIRLEHVFDSAPPNRSRLRPVDQIAAADQLAGGGDGFRYSAARFKDSAGASSIRVVARAATEKGTAVGTLGNTLRVRAQAFEMRTALAAQATDQQVVLESVAGLAIGDDLTLTDVASETHKVTAIGADNRVTLNTGPGGLTNAFPLGSKASVANRFTLAIFQDQIRPVTTSTTSNALAGATQIVVDNIAGLHTGDVLTLSDAAGGAETRAISTVDPGNVVKFAGGLLSPYQAGSLVTIAGGAGRALEPSEVHRNLSADPADPQYARTRLAVSTPAESSTLLCCDADLVLPTPAGEVTLIGGRDPGEIDFRWYTGYDVNGGYFVPLVPPGRQRERYGLATLEVIDEIDLVTAPDLAAQTLQPVTGFTAPDALYLRPHRQVLAHASRLGDRLAILNTRAGVVADVARLPQLLADPQGGGFGALYYPWVTVAIGDERRRIPSSGLVAGAMANTDARGGVGRAPANVPLRDVVDLEWLLEQRDQDDLNPAGVNAIRRFETPALELWGARTLSSDPSFRHVNVRRLVIAIKKAINRTLLWTVFEPNGPALRRKIQSSLESLMQTFVAGGATPGGRDAFFVKCDDENNPKAVSDLGQVIATIGVALVAPAEFIVLNVKRTPDAVSVTEQAA